MKATKTDRGPRNALTPQRVFAEAVKLADAGGIEALSMRKLAQALEVEAMSLYNHIAGKEELLDGIVECVISEMAIPDPTGDWRLEMHRRAHSMHEVLLRHPWSALLILSRVNVGPANLSHFNATLGCLMKAGFSPAEADWAWNALDSHLYGFTIQMLKFPFAPESYAEQAREFMPMIPAEIYPHLRALANEVAEGRHDGIQDFEFGLSMILDGLEARLRRR